MYYIKKKNKGQPFLKIKKEKIKAPLKERL